MCDEILICSANDFLEHLAPFTPDDGWIESALGRLEEKGLLGPPARRTRTAMAPNHRKTRTSARARESAVADVGPPEPEVDPKDTTSLRWEDYRDTGPQDRDASGMGVFKPLEWIVNALLECPDPDMNADRRRKSNGYSYMDCLNKEMGLEIMGANFKVDAMIVDPNLYKDKDIDLAVAQTAVVMKFKKEVTPENVYDNRIQLVSAANHIMSDDIRRNWMYGITVENTSMSLWYFSRSYSMKSAAIDFTQDFEKFIRIFLSFLYATEEELGYDPSIHRIYQEQNQTWGSVYEIQTEAGPKYYRTIQSLHNPRSLCITSRKSRVWKAVEVYSLSKLEPKTNAEVVLKDCWVDGKATTEMEIQKKIFKRLADVKEADYAWAPEGLKAKLKDALAHPEMYFMKIELDCDLGLNKAKPPFRPSPNLLLEPTEQSLADRNKTIPSNQTPPDTGYPSPHSLQMPPNENYIPRGYDVKRHYRVIYAEVGKSLAYAASLSDAVRAFEDIFIALTLLFLARWVHRDISEGNIILVCGKSGVRAKLSDLEYARPFGDKDGAVGADPKTGTPYFMSIEIHKGSFLYRKPVSMNIAMLSNALKRGVNLTTPTSPPLKYIFTHDLESLWWIMVWIMVMRIKGGPWNYRTIFAVLDFPSPSRETFFLKGTDIYEHLDSLIQNDTIRDCETPSFLTVYNVLLCQFYADGNRQDVTGYQHLYETVWNELAEFVRNMSNVIMELENPHLRLQPVPQSRPGDPEIRKRARSVSMSDTKTPTEGDSLRKKSKVGGDIFVNEEELAEDNRD